MEKPNEDKTEQIMVRVSPLEKLLILAAARKRGTYPSTFTREAAVRAAKQVTKQ